MVPAVARYAPAFAPLPDWVRAAAKPASRQGFTTESTENHGAPRRRKARPDAVQGPRLQRPRLGVTVEPSPSWLATVRQPCLSASRTSKGVDGGPAPAVRAFVARGVIMRNTAFERADRYNHREIDFYSDLVPRVGRQFRQKPRRAERQSFLLCDLQCSRRPLC